jgi:hypothetical protein
VSRTLSPVGCFGILSVTDVLGAFAFPSSAPFADFSTLTAPFGTTLAFVGLVAGALFPALALAVDAASGFLLPPTSFFHFLTVSFARSATFLSSCVRSLPTTMPSLVDCQINHTMLYLQGVNYPEKRLCGDDSIFQPVDNIDDVLSPG